MTDSFRGRRSMHTLRKLPTANPKMAKASIITVSMDAHCGCLMEALSTAYSVVRGFRVALHWFRSMGWLPFSY